MGGDLKGFFSGLGRGLKGIFTELWTVGVVVYPGIGTYREGCGVGRLTFQVVRERRWVRSNQLWEQVLGGPFSDF